jgi:hypothetical protein
MAETIQAGHQLEPHRSPVRKRAWMGTRRAAVCFLVMLCAACTTTSATRSFVEQSSPTSPSERATRPIFERACGSDVSGDLGRQWRSHATVVGPLAFVGLPEYADATPRTFSAYDGRYRARKVLIVVDRGASVTVTVPSAFRRTLGLLYDPAAFKEVGRYRVADGEAAVRFEPCELLRPTQFNGGLIAAGPDCYALRISVEGGPSRVLHFPLGRPC